MHRLHRSHRGLLVASVVAVVAMAAQATVVSAAGGLQYVKTNPVTQTCEARASVQSAATISSEIQWDCAVTVATNISPAGSSAGALTITASVPGAAFPCPSVKPSSPNATFTFDYTDAFGSVTWSAPQEWYLSGSSCVTDYPSGYSIPISVSGTSFFLYSTMSELCGFSIVMPFDANTGVALASDTVSFRVDNGASGTCTPSAA